MGKLFLVVHEFMGHATLDSEQIWQHLPVGYWRPNLWTKTNAKRPTRGFVPKRSTATRNRVPINNYNIKYKNYYE